VRKELRFIIPYIQRYRGILFRGILSLIFASLFSAAIPFLIKVAVDRLQQNRSSAVVHAVLLTGLFVLGQAFFKYVARTTILNGARGIEFEIRRDFYTHLISLPYGFFNNHHRGDLIARMMTDVGNIRMMVGMVTLHFSSTIATTVLSLVMMFKLSPLITLLSVIPLFLLLFVMRRFMTRLHRIFTEIQEVNGKLSRSVNEALSGIRVIKNYLLQEAEQRRFESINNDYRSKNLRATRLWGLLFPFIGFLGGLGTLVVMWIGGYYLMHHRITLGDFIALNTYYMMLMWPIAALGWILNLYQRGVASVQRVEAIFANEVERSDGIAPALTEGNIDFQDVTVVKGERTILDHVTFSVRSGEKVLIVGPTGSGKSTVINLLLGLEEEYEGMISRDGADIQKISLAALRKPMALVGQEPFLYSLSIADNVLVGGGRTNGGNSTAISASDRLEELLNLVNMKEEIERFDKGANTVVGERGIMLSGGQKQRLTLARALAKEPTILLLDDPLTHVDGYTEHLIWQRLTPLFQGRTVVVVSSRPVPLSHVDKVMVLAEGRVADYGIPEELLGRNPYMRLLYEVKG
jgi:ATP-binding cassette, subfamily B, multidrug efflux pump